MTKSGIGQDTRAAMCQRVQPPKALRNRTAAGHR